MVLIQPRIIALDSSQWANWLDDSLRPGRARRGAARGFHRRMMDAGLIAIFSWHHLEELLAIADAALARDRLAFIAALPLIAWQSTETGAGPGGIIHILAAEAMALLESARDLASTRDRARTLMLRTGSGEDLLGPDLRVWEVVRADGAVRREKHQLMATLRPMTLFDEQRTVGEVARGWIRPRREQAAMLQAQRDAMSRALADHGDKRMIDPSRIAEAFYADVAALAPPEDITVRQLIEATLVSQGVDPHEITDDRILADLSELATFRSQLRTIARLTGTSFATLKGLTPAAFPHHRLDKALREHGQKRDRRPASDVNDGYLAALAPYCDQLYVDKRTAEDFRRVITRDPILAKLVGKIRRVCDYEAVLGVSV